MYQDEKLPPSNYAIIRWFGFDQFIPEATVTSYWMSSKAFFIIRFIITLYSTIVIWTYIGVTGPYMKYFFDMFTHLTFIGLHAYLVVSTAFLYLMKLFNITYRPPLYTTFDTCIQKA